MNSFEKIIGVFFMVMLVGLLTSFIAAVPVYFLWNWIVPVVFHFRTITYWQSWGLLLLIWLFQRSPTVSKNS